MQNVTEIYLLGKESRVSAMIEVSLEIQRGDFLSSPGDPALEKPPYGRGAGI